MSKRNVRRAKRPSVTDRSVRQIESLEARQMLTSQLLSEPIIPVGDTLTTYRIAIATTGEFTTGIGGKEKAEAFIDRQVELLNELYGRELAINFELVPNNGEVVFTDPATDPYESNENNAILTPNHNALAARIGLNNFDIGHVFPKNSSGGGLATLGAVGNDSYKGQGASATSTPSEIDEASFFRVFSHEVGHQFDGQHSFNGVRGACENRETDDGEGEKFRQGQRIEPGSGSTVMSYGGLCDPDFDDENNPTDDFVDFSDNYFHAASYHQVRSWVNGHGGRTTETGNQPPAVQGGSDYTIPKGTPFVLTASATDDGPSDKLTYTWEQMDVSTSQDGQTVPIPDGADAEGPLFRSFPPTESPTRTFPQLDDILNNVTVSKAEKLPSQPRDLNFRVAVRDNFQFNGRTVSGVNADDVKLTVANAGPFLLTSGNAAAELNGGTPYNVTWSVAGTNGGDVNTQNVKISLSLDGGKTFSHVLADSVPNNGSATVTLPNVETTKARFKVEAVGNIFFDINNSDQTINFNSEAPGVSVSGNLSQLREDGGEATYTLSLNTPANNVAIAINGGSQLLISQDNGATFAALQTVIFNDTNPKTITVKAVNDGAAEGPHSQFITHTITSGNGAYTPNMTISDINVSIIDDEIPPIVGIKLGAGDRTVWNELVEIWDNIDTDLEDDLGTSVDYKFTATELSGTIYGTEPTEATVPRHTPDISDVSGFAAFDNLTLEWSSLTPEKVYNVYAFGLFEESDGFTGIDQTVSFYGLHGNPITISQSTSTPSQLIVNGEVGSSDRTLESFAIEVTASADGTISADYSSADGKKIFFAGAAIQEKPSPVVATPGITLSSTAGLTTTEAGGTGTYTVKLDTEPTSDVTINLSSNDESEGRVSPAQLVFTAGNWSTAQQVTVTGQDDNDADGDVVYRISATSVSADPSYNNVIIPVVPITNRDDDEPVVGDNNDLFADATALVPGEKQEINTNDFGREEGEPPHAGNRSDKTAWYNWTAPAAGNVTISTDGSDFDTVLAVYTGGAVNTLTSIVANDDVEGARTSQVEFQAVAGTTYRIAVAGYNDAAGDADITLNFTPITIGNDNFADATTLTPGEKQEVDTTEFTREDGEPQHGDNRSDITAWYNWTAPSVGDVSIHTDGSDFDTILAVYTGDAVNALTSVVSNDDVEGARTSRVEFRAMAGTTYRIALAGYDASAGNADITLDFTPVATSNDDFANAFELSGLSASAEGSNVDATGEAGEPSNAGQAGGKSLWWKWTTPEGATSVTIDTAGSNFDTTLGVYTGASVGSLTEVASNDDVEQGNTTSSVTFAPVTGTTYYISIDGYNGDTGNFSLSLAARGSERVLGDSNNDGVFNSADLVVVFIAGQYEDAIPGNSVWETGDWNGDGDFTSSDLVTAFIAGTYQAGAIPGAVASSIFDRYESPSVQTPASVGDFKLVDIAFAMDDDESEFGWR